MLPNGLPSRGKKQFGLGLMKAEKASDQKHHRGVQRVLLCGGDRDDSGVTAGPKHPVLRPCWPMSLESICRETLKSLTYFGEEREAAGLGLVLLSSKG